MPSSASCPDAHAVMRRPLDIRDRTANDAVVLSGGRILTCVDTGGPSPSNVKLSLTNVVVVTDAFHRESGSGIDVNPGPIEIGEFGC